MSPRDETGEDPSGEFGRVTAIEQRVDRLYREHFGEGDYEGTREQLRQLRHSLERHFREYNDDKNEERRDRSEDRENTQRMFNKLERDVLQPIVPRWLTAGCIVVATLALVWMALTQVLR